MNKVMTATKQKVIYFMRPAPLNYKVSDVSNICFTKKIQNKQSHIY